MLKLLKLQSCLVHSFIDAKILKVAGIKHVIRSESLKKRVLKIIIQISLYRLETEA